MSGELKIGQIGAAVASAQPVLLLGEVVVANAGTVQLAQRGFGRPKIVAFAMRLGDVQGQALDPAAHQCMTADQAARRRRDAGLTSQRKGAALTVDQCRAKR